MAGEQPLDGGTRPSIARDLDEDSITAAVIARMQLAKSARFKKVMSLLVQHMHDFAREAELTEEEWSDGIDFLTRTGHMCDEKRQEFILLSDVLGLSTLVTQLNHSSEQNESEQTVFGPFHRQNAPRFALGDNIAVGVRGKPCFVEITVKSPDGEPLPEATVDVWHSDAEGNYDLQRAEWGDEMHLRGIFKPDLQGKVYFRTIVPRYYPVPTDGPVGELLKASGRHPMRPSHMHFMVQAPGYDRLVTHVFAKNDRYLDSDPVFGVRNALISDYQRHRAGLAPDGTRIETSFYTLCYHFVMRPLNRS